jgi:tetratricopeptide (TPR) repeat protein
VYRAEAYLAKGEYEQVIADSKKMLQVTLNAPSHTRAVLAITRACEKSQQWDNAVAGYSRLIELKPEERQFLIGRADAHMQLEQWDKAIVDYDQAIKLNPNDTQTYVDRSKAHRRKGDYATAIEDCSSALRVNPKALGALHNRAIAHRLSGHYDQALSDLNTGLMIKPDHDRLLHERGLTYSHLEAHEKAITDFNEVIRIKPTSQPAHIRRAEAHLAMGDYDQAIADYREAIRLDPTHPGGYLGRAATHLRLENYDQAIEDYRQVIKAKPTHRESWERLLDIEVARGASAERTQAIIAEAEAALGGTGLLTQHATWHLLSNRRDEYEEICRALAAKFAESTDFAEVSMVAGAAALTKEPVLETEQLVDMASRAVQADPAAWRQKVLGLCLLRDGQADAAIERFDQSLGRNLNGEPASWLVLAIAHAAAGRTSEAQDWLKKAKEWFQHNPLDLTSRIRPGVRMQCQLLLREAEQLIERGSSTETEVKGMKKTP